jgi:hypothetical protein
MTQTISPSDFNEVEWREVGETYENIKLESDLFGSILTKREFRSLKAAKKKYLEYFNLIDRFRTQRTLANENDVKEFLDQEFQVVDLTQEVLQFEDEDENIIQRVFMDEPDFIGIEHGSYEMLLTKQNWEKLVNLVNKAINIWAEQK